VSAHNVEILDRLRAAGALMEGHFRLTSGLHSGSYIQCAKALVFPGDIRFLAERLVRMIPETNYVVSPAIGALVIGHAVADRLSVPFVFAERNAEGRMAIRRGQSVPGGMRAVIVEDVVTTGGSVAEVVELLGGEGVEVRKIVSIARRNDMEEIAGVPFESLVFLDFNQYEPEVCPLCTDGTEIEKPGSRR